MKDILKTIKISFLFVGVMTLLCGGIYTLVVTAIGQTVFPLQANGSQMVETTSKGTINYGSQYLGQQFSNTKYMIGRPIQTTMYAATSDEMKQELMKREAFVRSLDPANMKDIPADLIMPSASGVDPNISVDAAKYQVSRIARERSIAPEEVQKIIDKYTTNSIFGFLGEPVVNVLQVNLALDKKTNK